MTGRQNNPSNHKRENRFTSGHTVVVREQKVFSFKAYKDIYPVVMRDLSERQITTQQLCDEMLEVFYGGETAKNIDSPLLTEAIRSAIFAKESAIRGEKKKRSPDLQVIAVWQKEIEELQTFL